MSTNRLLVTIDATHRSLQQRLSQATHVDSAGAHPRTRYARTDALLAATCRHLAAVEDALLDVARQRLPDGHDRVKAYLAEARLLERAMAMLKARLYGEVHAAYLPWSEVWAEVRRDLATHNESERALVEDLVAVLGEPDSGALADEVYRAEVKAPTRAHPYLPHTGRLGHAARRMWSVADHFWDTAEGRVVPRPAGAPSKEHRHDSLVAQYLVGEPLLDADAPLIAHRRDGTSGSKVDRAR